MNSKELKNRTDIADIYKWNIEKMYPDESIWEADIEDAKHLAEEFENMKGHLMDSPSSLLNAINLYIKMMKKSENVIVYAHMKHDEDNSNAKYTEMDGRASSMISQIYASAAFFVPELLSSSVELIREYIAADPEIKKYEFMLEQIIRKKTHVLSEKEETLIASVGEILDAPNDIFTMLNNADLSFGKCTDDNGDEVELTHGSYIGLMESENRNIRRNVFERFYNEYRQLNNTLSVMYNYNVKKNVLLTKLRKYPSALEAALSSENIPVTVYDNLIEAVHEFLPSMHRYIAIRKRVMGLDSLKMYDIYKPLVKPADLEFTYDQAVALACEALMPLGDEYVDTFRRGLTEERWVDIYENKGKTSGAYSFGSYESMPYILMNFAGELRDVFTLIHEGGHSMHSYYTRKAQPYIYGSHSIFTAEVASTVNETFLMRFLLAHPEKCMPKMKKSDIPENVLIDIKIYLLNFYIDEFKSTLIRQTMFAEFEKNMHAVVENGGSLTAEHLNNEYDRLNTNYFGSALTHDDLIQYEWSRIPHFYRSFYVYQYATGYSAANAIVNGILSGGTKERDDYIRFLSAGDSDDPIPLLRIAGVNMENKAPVVSALSTFSDLISRLEVLL